jgi:hypothetical protein
VLTGLLLRLSWYGFVPWPAPVDETASIVGKEDLALPRLVHAVSLAFLIASLVPREARWMRSVTGQVLAVIGRHSLQVFCVGLFLSWAASAAFRLLPAFWWLDLLLITSGVVLLAAVARRVERGPRPARSAIAKPEWR